MIEIVLFDNFFPIKTDGQGIHTFFLVQKRIIMKKKLAIQCWYQASKSHGSLAVDHPVGYTDLNTYSERFSDPKNGIVVRYAAITRGFSISGSRNGRPLSEDALWSYAGLCIDLIRGADEVVIEWQDHDFLTARRTGERRGCPLFGLGQTPKNIAFESYMNTLAQERNRIPATA